MTHHNYPFFLNDTEVEKKGETMVMYHQQVNSNSKQTRIRSFCNAELDIDLGSHKVESKSN